MKRIWCVVVVSLFVGLVFGITRSMHAAPLQNDVQSVLSEPSAMAYVCRVGPHYADGAATRGDFGHIWVWFKGEAHCGGVSRGSGYLHSTGATHAQSHPDYLYSEGGLIAMAEMLQSAAISGEVVRYSRCSDEKTSCVKYVQFRGTAADVEVD